MARLRDPRLLAQAIERPTGAGDEPWTWWDILGAALCLAPFVVAALWVPA